jgi:NDP-sugar pyrophosphorylase family protein
VEVPDIGRFGSIELAADGSVAQFVEKDPTRQGAGLINGGVYLFSSTALAALSACSATSLERDYLMLQPEGTIHAHLQKGARFIDIGTPQSLAEAGSVISLATSVQRR